MNLLMKETYSNIYMPAIFYITPYLNEAQITSGTLSYAVGVGGSSSFQHLIGMLQNCLLAEEGNYLILMTPFNWQTCSPNYWKTRMS